jgi:hypothetical protein
MFTNLKQFIDMKYSKIYLSLLAFGMLTQQSCLKDNPNNASPLSGTNNVVQFLNSSIPTYNTIWPEYDNGLTIKNDTGSFPVNLSWTGAESKTSRDITVTVALDTAALNNFNTANGSDFKMLPDGSYTFPSTAVIPKGSSKVQIRPIITTVPGWDYSQTYALPLHIVSSSFGLVSSNYGTAIYTVVANNIFAGTYTSTGYLFHPTSPRDIDDDYTVTTTGMFENRFPFGDLGPNGYYFALTTPASGGGAVTGYRAMGAPAAPASGLMTADNPGGTAYPTAPTPPGSGDWIQSKYNNTYDAANKTYWLHVGYASGATGQSQYTRQLYMKMVQD